MINSIIQRAQALLVFLRLGHWVYLQDFCTQRDDGSWVVVLSVSDAPGAVTDSESNCWTLLSTNAEFRWGRHRQ